jgi:hypothetical protein
MCICTAPSGPRTLRFQNEEVLKGLQHRGQGLLRVPSLGFFGWCAVTGVAYISGVGWSGVGYERLGATLHVCVK